MTPDRETGFNPFDMISIHHTDERWPDVEGTPIPLFEEIVDVANDEGPE